jgi:hypothetical protein
MQVIGQRPDECRTVSERSAERGVAHSGPADPDRVPVDAKLVGDLRERPSLTSRGGPPSLTTCLVGKVPARQAAIVFA